jgi:hypothetical protein
MLRLEPAAVALLTLIFSQVVALPQARQATEEPPGMAVTQAVLD